MFLQKNHNVSNNIDNNNCEKLDLEITYSILYSNLSSQLKNILTLYEPSCIKSQFLKKYLDDIYKKHYNKILTRSHLVRELFLLYQTCLALKRFNDEELKLSYREYRAKILYPNIVYILIRLMPKARVFLQTIIKNIYNETKRKSNNVVQAHTNSFYIDQDVIKTDILYLFLGNAMLKFNPLEVNDINIFYKQVFRNILFYYFKKEQRLHTELTNVLYMDDPLKEMVYVPTGLSIYRDVLYSLQVEKTYSYSPTLNQLKYNYSIFRNVILNNEFQNIYLSTKKDMFIINDNHYKLTSIYSEDIDKQLEKIRSLPTIYKLLKSVHILSKNKAYNESIIKPELIKVAVLEELMFPFRNMFSNENIYEVLEKVAENFTNSILTGEYINLMTLSTIKINQISFINQVKKFIRICLSDT